MGRAGRHEGPDEAPTSTGWVRGRTRSRRVAGFDTRLVTPPLPCLVPERVFDDFAWCASDTLDTHLGPQARLDRPAPIDAHNPGGMVFVFHAPCTFLPTELARLHAPGLDFGEELALAPYAIDDATDLLHANRIAPRSVLGLVARSVDALFWGLHDWSHFHNHGPFEERAWTELQCDGAALAWLVRNRATLGLDDHAIARARREVRTIAEARFRDEDDADGATHVSSILDACIAAINR